MNFTTMNRKLNIEEKSKQIHFKLEWSSHFQRLSSTEMSFDEIFVFSCPPINPKSKFCWNYYYVTSSEEGISFSTCCYCESPGGPTLGPIFMFMENNELCTTLYLNSYDFLIFKLKFSTLNPVKEFISPRMIHLLANEIDSKFNDLILVHESKYDSQMLVWSFWYRKILVLRFEHGMIFFDSAAKFERLMNAPIAVRDNLGDSMIVLSAPDWGST